MESAPISQISSVQLRARSGRRCRSRRCRRTTHSTVNNPTPIRLEHHIFSRGEWKRAKLRDHPQVLITISVDRSVGPRGSVNNRGLDNVVDISAVANTGAQSNLWSLEEFLTCGFSRDDLLPVNLSLSAANRSSIAIEGAFFARLSTAPSDSDSTSCRSMVYVSSSVRAMYLSYESLLDLGLLPMDFPSSNGGGGPGDKRGPGTPDKPLSVNAAGSTKGGCKVNPQVTQCSCPQRTAPPSRPQALPFPCTPENNGRMKVWLLERYASSTFNTCPHQALPCMEGPPVDMHVDPAAKPKACHTAATVPLHWQQRVYDDLLWDEALGVIERVPYGEPVTWCHRMVVTRKHDGSPRRTVDLSPLNKFCQRETFATESPFHLARRIPRDTWRTVTDAWNGYHSVPLRASDRHLTTFITPFGRWRYTRAPQGFLSSGDGYNRRFDAVLSDFERKERCVDDTIHYDTDLGHHWWRTIDFLARVGRSGIVLNPDKFQFAERSVDFAGFRVSDTTIEPLPKYLDAIRDFPTPESTTDIRSWFGLVNQVSNYAQLRDTMAPFKPFLSPRCKFSWSPELEKAFQKSKLAIVGAICEGVEIYDMRRRVHLPGKSNHAADATSRHPSPSGSANGFSLGSQSAQDAAESALMASIRDDAQELGAISWSIIARETAADACLGHLLYLIEHEGRVDVNDPVLASLSPVCESSYTQDGVLLYQDRVVVPPSLRGRVLQHLHAAHQGTSAMEQHARAIVFWPGMSEDIRTTDCNRNAPSQAATPSLLSPPPSTPFEAVFADFFHYGGCH